MRSLLGASLAVLLCACAPQALRAPSADELLRKAIEAAQRVKVGGPADVRLADRTLLRLQAGMAYVRAAQGGPLLDALAERRKEGLLGVVIYSTANSAAIALVYAEESGAPGMPRLGVDGWREAPSLAGFGTR